MKKHIVCFGVALMALAVLAGNPGMALAAAISAGNNAVARAQMDTFQNFTVVDYNTPVSSDGTINLFNYYASSTYPFNFLFVDNDNRVRWMSDQITPSATGARSYNLATAVTVEKDWRLGVYFPATSTIPFEHEGAAAHYTADNSGMPAVDTNLTYAGYDIRKYSFGATGTAAGAATALTMPTFVSPANNATSTGSFTVDWTDATGTAPIEYQLQYFKNNVYTANAPTYDSGWLDESQKSLSGLAGGDYYLRVRSKDGNDNLSSWSNGVVSTYKLTVVGAAGADDDVDATTTMPIGDVLAKKAACMKGAWQAGGFKNQGQCVAHYNQMILGHIEKLVKTLVEKMKELQVEVKKQNDIAKEKGFANWGQYKKSLNANKGNGKNK